MPIATPVSNFAMLESDGIDRLLEAGAVFSVVAAIAFVAYLLLP